jgi:hypothetical protein
MKNKTMPFEKNHKLSFLPKGSEPLDRQPLTMKVRLGIRAKVMAIPDWQSQLREVIELCLESKTDLNDQT